MKTVELKEKLIEEIQLTNNKLLLKEIYRFLNLENNMEKIHKLNYGQKSAIKEASEQIKNGDCLTNEEANRGIDDFLKPQKQPSRL